MYDDSKPVGHSKSSSKREVYNSIILPQETRKIPNKQPTLTPKATREREKGESRLPKQTKIQPI